jgi:hypothetical protein
LAKAHTTRYNEKLNLLHDLRWNAWNRATLSAKAIVARQRGGGRRTQ